MIEVHIVDVQKTRKKIIKDFIFEVLYHLKVIVCVYNISSSYTFLPHFFKQCIFKVLQNKPIYRGYFLSTFKFCLLFYNIISLVYKLCGTGKHPDRHV